ncbi:MAG TPA: branched-chain amino acid ABC transporter ATP-binding protein/permease [Solirubrobacterales bacterium]|jgi:branched-chain amino acid transport system permease protein|nr:branched-chain amino acid ABC transporter ATP-binding protein/permease [Solirubrobacterales bacterium]
MSGVRFRTRQSAAASLLVPLLLIAIVALLGANGTPSFQDTVTTILCNLIVVIGLQVFVGNSGVYSFGQLGFATAGAYIAAFLTLPAAFVALQTPGLPHFIANAHLGALPSTLIAAAISGLLAIVVGLPLMRTSTLAIPISTFAFLLVVYNVVANWDRVTGGSSGLVSIPTTTSVESAALWAGAAVIVALAYKWSASGYRLQATREDEVAARSIGIGVMRERLIAFGLSGVLCGVGGALAVHQSGVLNPATFYFGATVTTMTMLVVGGARSVFGATIGAIAISAVNELLRGVENGASLFGAISIGEAPGLAAIGLGLILLATMIAMPNGLSGGREAGELSWLQRLGLSAPAPAPRPDETAVGEVAIDRAAQGGGLRAEDISLAFAGLRVLKNVDLTLGPGEALGLIGPNGAGKTTLVNVLSGFQAPDSGNVSLDGVVVTGRSPARLAHDGLGRTFQAALPFPDLSGLESVAVGALGMGVSRRRAVAVAADVLGRLGLLEQARLPAGALPPGSQRLLGVARALAIGPRYLLLDEPAAGLNEAECEQLVAILRNVLSDFGCGILLIEHDMNIVMPLCSRVQVLDDGMTIRVGTPQEVQGDPAVVESYLGSSFLAAADA